MSRSVVERRALAVVLPCAISLSLSILARNAVAQHRPSGTPRPSFAEPAISPDGREIAFVSAGDIWVVPANGGDAHLLVSDPATESRPLYSPDGKRLAFVSTRAGSPDVWVLDLATGAVRRLTFDDGAEQLDAWSRDGKWIYFSSGTHDVSGLADEYRVGADGGTPMIVSGERYFAEFMGAPSPDGTTIAVVARGQAQSQWWRRGRSHLDESELWLVRGDGSTAPTYQQLTALGAKRQWPMWDEQGRTLYFVSDEGGPQNLWSIGVASGTSGGLPTARQLTHFNDGRVLFPTITPDGKTIAFERDFCIWTADAATGATRQVPITLKGAIAGTPPEHVVMTSNFQEMTLSPDGKKIAFTARGDVFAIPAADGGEGSGQATRVTNTPAIESQLSWAPDSRRLMYASNRDGAWHLYAYDFATGAETQLTRGDKSDIQARWSPDGSQIAFVRDAREVHVLDVASGRDRVIAHGTFSRPPFGGSGEGTVSWSPDGKFVAFLSAGTKMMLNAYVAPVGGVEVAASGTGEQVTFLSNTSGTSLHWSPDGSYLILASSMRTEQPVVARVDLVPHVPRLREDQFDALFRDQTPGRTTQPMIEPRPETAVPVDSATRRDHRAAAPKVRMVLDGIRDRLTVVPTGLDVTSLSLSRDGKSMLLVADAAGQQNIYVYSLDESAPGPAVARQITSTAGRKASVQWAPDGKSIYYLEQGRIMSVVVDTRAVHPIAARAELDVDFDREKMEVFNQAWEFLNDNFYDPNFHGRDWNAVHAEYAPVIAGARTPDEMRRLLSLMIGEMNGSHMGIGGPPSGSGPVTGHLGLFFDRAAYEQRGVLKVTGMVPLSPAAISDSIHVGDVITAVDGVHIDAHTSLDSLLDYTIGKRVLLSVSDPRANATRTVELRPVNSAGERALLYRAWVDERRAYVSRISGGRLGYVHMADMGANAINQLDLDLDSENQGKEGIVLDIRNNNGGFVNGYALDVLSRQPYVLMVRRGVPPVDGRPVLGQRALEAPTILVTNQATLSDGENFTYGYETMKLGKVVGEPTAGWDVYTGAGTMVDGTTVRLPFMRNGELDGTPLELRPRPVDIAVERAMGESEAGRDSQLDAAVKELLREIDTKAGKR